MQLTGNDLSRQNAFLSKFGISSINDIPTQKHIPKANHGVTILHHASRKGHLEIVKLLLARNDGLMWQGNSGGNIALEWAAYWGHSDVVKMLLETKWMDNLPGKGAFVKAIAKCHRDCAKLLLETRRSKSNSGFVPGYFKKTIDNFIQKETVVQSILPLSLLSI